MNQDPRPPTHNRPPTHPQLVARLAVVVLALFVAAACGSDDETTVDTGDAPDVTASPDDDDTADGDSDDPTPAADDDEPLGQGPYPIGDLTVELDDGETVSTYQITCLGDTATLSGDEVDVNDRRACLALAEPEVQERLVEGPPDVMCTSVYGGPQTAAITGTLDDQPVDTTVDRTNGCGISDWDDLLADILPPVDGA